MLKITDALGHFILNGSCIFSFISNKPVNALDMFTVINNQFSFEDITTMKADQRVFIQNV